MVKINPCPFCGSKNVKIEAGNEENKIPAYVFCRDCVAVGPSADNSWEAECRWNVREVTPQITSHFLTIKQVSIILGISRATIYRLMQVGQFPRPIRPKGTKLNRWALHDIEAYRDECEVHQYEENEQNYRLH